ncbi:MAG: hypothetical protein AAGF15_10165, partial [Pseudomonadota bacterium]
LRSHIESWVQEPFDEGLSETNRLKTSLYDWHLADLSGGSHHQGQWNNSAALIAGLENGSGTSALEIGNLSIRRDGSRKTLSPLTLDLLMNMQEFNDRQRSTVITVEDCPEDGCETPVLDDEEISEGDADQDRK